jgi:hypothetical protein
MDYSSLSPVRWFVEHAFVLVPAQSLVGGHLATLQEFPPRQRPRSFSIGQAMEKLMNQPSNNQQVETLSQSSGLPRRNLSPQAGRGGRQAYAEAAHGRADPGRSFDVMLEIGVGQTRLQVREHNLR